MAAFTLKRRIERPRAEVFSLFTEFQEMPARISGIKELEVLSNQPVGNGFRWRETREIFGKQATEEMWITAFQPEHSYTVEAESHGTHYTTVLEFEPVGHATDVSCRFEAKPVSLLAKILSPLGSIMMGSMKKLMAQDIEDLKAVAEKTA